MFRPHLISSPQVRETVATLPVSAPPAGHENNYAAAKDGEIYRAHFGSRTVIACMILCLAKLELAAIIVMIIAEARKASRTNVWIALIDFENQFCGKCIID